MKFLIDIKKFTQTIVRHRHTIYELAKRDFESQYKSTYLGFIWGFLHPVTYVLVVLLVFTIGLRSPVSRNGIPFVIFLISGMIPWQFFSTTLSSITRVINSHSYLIKKGDLSLAILHIARILSNLVTHVLLVVIIIFIAWAYGYIPGIQTFQLIYYIFAMSVLLLGSGWITSSTSLFIEDVANLVTVSIQFGFWLTPIIWDISIVPAKYRWILKLNPVCYIITGYRDSLFNGPPFWVHIHETLYFWGATTIILVAGAVIFRRLKPHFGEVI